MKNFDSIFKAQEEQRKAVFDAMKNGDVEQQQAAMNTFFEGIQTSALTYVKEATETQNVAMADTNVLIDRGVLKQITTEERRFCNAVIEKGGFENLEETMPQTMIEDVLSNLHRKHELIQFIDLRDTKALAKYIFAKPTAATAFWGEICSDIKQMILEGFTVVEAAANKLSGFVPICKGMLELGPEWLATYIIECMYEAMSVQLEIGIIRGQGKGKHEPVGMTMSLTGAVDGVHKKKTATALKSFNPDELGKIMGKMAKNEVLNGEMILIVNPVTYWTILFPALAVRSPEGQWILDRLPIGAKIIQSYAAEEDEGVLGVGKNYFLGVAGKVRIDKYTETLAIEDMDLYIAKAYCYGQPKDENAFELLNLKNVKPLPWPPVEVTEGTTK